VNDSGCLECQNNSLKDTAKNKGYRVNKNKNKNLEESKREGTGGAVEF
jgi:hypothetical protein